jgi:hypothetical protein
MVAHQFTIGEIFDRIPRWMTGEIPNFTCDPRRVFHMGLQDVNTQIGGFLDKCVQQKVHSRVVCDSAAAARGLSRQHPVIRKEHSSICKFAGLDDDTVTPGPDLSATLVVASELDVYTFAAITCRSSSVYIVGATIPGDLKLTEVVDFGGVSSGPLAGRILFKELKEGDPKVDVWSDFGVSVGLRISADSESVTICKAKLCSPVITSKFIASTWDRNAEPRKTSDDCHNVRLER